MSLQNNNETPSTLMSKEDWEKALHFSKSASEITSPHGNDALRLRAIKTIGNSLGLSTPVDGDSRFDIFSSREEIRKELEEPWLSIGLRILLYEALASLRDSAQSGNEDKAQI